MKLLVLLLALLAAARSAGGTAAPGEARVIWLPVDTDPEVKRVDCRWTCVSLGLLPVYVSRGRGMTERSCLLPAGSTTTEMPLPHPPCVPPCRPLLVPLAGALAPHHRALLPLGWPAVRHPEWHPQLPRCAVLGPWPGAVQRRTLLATEPGLTRLFPCCHTACRHFPPALRVFRRDPAPLPGEPPTWHATPLHQGRGRARRARCAQLCRSSS